MKIIFYLLILIIHCNSLYAEFICSSEVKYRWRKGQEEEIVAMWAKIERGATTEVESKTALNKATERERIKAEEYCKREHEDVSGCIATKLNSLQPTLSGLTFSARKKLEESLIDDCQRKQGSCIKVEIAEATCIDNKPPEAAATAEDDKAKKKK
jgi:hypothetical protein